MRITIHDIARAAGVSPSTVSRAMAPDGIISPETRARVREAAERLGYRPNRAAQGMVTGRTRNLGLVVPDLRNPFFADIAKGVQAQARMLDYEVFISDSDEHPGTEIETISSLRRGVDGLVLCSPRAPDGMLLDRADPRATVLLHRQIPGFGSVTADLAGGMRQAVDHLRALGHTTIAYVSGPLGSWAGEQRRQGLVQLVSDAGPELVEIGGRSSQFEGGVAAVDPLLASAATAVIAYNDVVALGLLSRLVARGVSVPDEMSIIGCDDVTIASMSTPALTTVSVPKSSSARTGVDLLLRIQTDATYEPEDLVLPTQLIVRGSTSTPGPARRS